MEWNKNTLASHLCGVGQCTTFSFSVVFSTYIRKWFVIGESVILWSHHISIGKVKSLSATSSDFLENGWNKKDIVANLLRVLFCNHSDATVFERDSLKKKPTCIFRYLIEFHLSCFISIRTIYQKHAPFWDQRKLYYKSSPAWSALYITASFCNLSSNISLCLRFQIQKLGNQGPLSLHYREGFYTSLRSI